MLLLQRWRVDQVLCFKDEEKLSSGSDSSEFVGLPEELENPNQNKSKPENKDWILNIQKVIFELILCCLIVSDLSFFITDH